MKYLLRYILFALILQCVPVLKVSAQPEHPRPRQADSAKQCAICHYRWVFAFFVEHRSTPIAPLQEKKVVGSQEMCLSCHDGSVMDSRDRICNDPGHRVGNIPSKRVRIPATFPLDQFGRMTCSTCHTPHATTKEEGKIGGFFLRAPNINSSFCKQCHITKTGGKADGNHPTDISAQDVPQQVLDAGGRLGTDMPNQIICETCHSPHGGVNNRFLVLTVEDPKTRSVLCEACHTKKPGLTGDEAHHQNSHPYDLTPGKIPKIPKKWNNGQEVVLGTGGELVCRTCHIPHAAADKQALLVERNSNDSLCIECHGDHKNIASSSHYRTIVDPEELNIKGQKASDLGPCSPCHLVHHGAGKLMWARTSAQISGRPGEYCNSCHQPGGAAEKVMPKEFSHPIDITMTAKTAPGVLPLFDDIRGENPDGKIRCATCHNFHDPYPMFDDPDNKGTQQGKYLRFSEQGASGVCMQCHPRQGLVKNTDHDLTLIAPDFVNAQGITVSQGGVCSPCHSVHQDQQQKLLWAAPRGPAKLQWWNQTYSSDYNVMTMLCTGCHAPDSIGAEKIPKYGLHPKDFLVPGRELTLELSDDRPTRFEDDDFPLYSDDGEIIDTGNIVCVTCHNPHQWEPYRQAQGPGRNVEGNVANSFLRPGLDVQFCSRCHGRDSLIMYQYFHRDIGREKTEPSFSFK